MYTCLCILLNGIEYDVLLLFTVHDTLDNDDDGDDDDHNDNYYKDNYNKAL